MGFFGGPEKMQIMTDSQVRSLDQMTGQLERNIGQGVESYGGQITPDATANQLAAFQGAGNLFSDPRVDSSGAINQLMSGDPAFQIDPAQREAFYQDALVAPARAQFQDTLQQVDQRYGAGFGEAGAMRGMANRATADFETNLMGKRAELIYADEMARRGAAESGMNRMVQGVGLAPTYDANRRQNLGLQATLGGEERAIAGQHAGEAYNKWQTEQDYNNPWLGFFGSAMSAQPNAIVNKPGMFGNVVGAISSTNSMFDQMGKMGWPMGGK